jgi:ankyrin repeat protein
MGENVYNKSFGRTALIEACERGLKSVVEALIAAHADLNMRDTRGRTALISACVWGHDEIAKGKLFVFVECDYFVSSLV